MVTPFFPSCGAKKSEVVQKANRTRNEKDLLYIIYKVYIFSHFSNSEIVMVAYLLNC